MPAQLRAIKVIAKVCQEQQARSATNPWAAVRMEGGAAELRAGHCIAAATAASGSQQSRRAGGAGLPVRCSALGMIILPSSLSVGALQHRYSLPPVQPQRDVLSK
jgi:hypothetical protein